jgi:hypothetical protein
VPYEDTAERAWQKLFGDPLPRMMIYVDPSSTDHAYAPNPHWIAHHDGGDAVYLLDADGRVYCSSYPGNQAIGRLGGPGPTLPCPGANARAD